MDRRMSEPEYCGIEATAKNVEHVLHPSLPVRRQAPQVGATDQHCPRAEGKSLRDVAAPADATVEGDLDPITHRRIDVLPDRRAATLSAWLRDRPGITAVCRDGSASYAEAITAGAPEAVQVSDRWHLWHGLGCVHRPTERCVHRCVRLG